MKDIERIVFIQPSKTSPIDNSGTPVQKVRANMSIAACTIIGALEHAGFDVTFIDATAEGSTVRIVSDQLISYGLTNLEIIERVQNANPDAVLITSMFTSEQMMVDSLVNNIKLHYPDTLMIIGGIHASIKPEWHFDRANPDFVIIGEGEETIVELLRVLSTPNGDPRKIPGLMFKSSSGNLIQTSPRSALSNISQPWALNTVLKLPNGHMRYNDKACRKSPIYRTNSGQKDRSTYVLFGSRGCPFGCAYCASTRRTGNQVRHIGADTMFSQFLTARTNFGIEVFSNQADVFGNHQEDINFLTQVAQYRNNNKDFSFTINNPNAFFVSRFFNAGRNPEINHAMIELLCSAAFNVVTIAVETTIMRFNSKINWSRITKDHVIALAKVIKSKGLRLDVYMMYGFPTQTINEFNEDVRFGQAIAEIADAVTWHRMSLLPGTAYYDEYIHATGLENTYRRFTLEGKGSCFYDGNELNLSRVSSNVMNAAIAEFGPGWFETDAISEGNNHANC